MPAQTGIRGSKPKRKAPVKPSRGEAESTRVKAILRILDQSYPGADCALDRDSPFQLLCATILSAQCTDERVNMVTPALFARFPTPAAMAQADQGEVENIIRSTGFYRNKAKNLISASRILVERWGGDIPRSMDQLLQLPGVARKTANVVLGTAFGIADGVVVDTHVMRLSQRLALTRQITAEKIEIDLMRIVPRERWILFSHQLILHGRRICVARKPRCDECPLAPHCPSAFHAG